MIKGVRRRRGDADSGDSRVHRVVFLEARGFEDGADEGARVQFTAVVVHGGAVAAVVECLMIWRCPFPSPRQD